jgi:hypothetical protein
MKLPPIRLRISGKYAEIERAVAVAAAHFVVERKKNYGL